MEHQRIDQKLTEEFAKNSEFETILNSLNNCLSQEEEKLLTDKGDIFPTIHILGAPRSGTTLASQILLSYLPIGYINNLIAAFWKAPLYGIELSKKLLGGNYVSNFQSVFGRTYSIREPHEFGYFWNFHLSYNNLQQKDKIHEEKINWTHLALLLNNMTYHFNRPVLFKSFLFGFHAAHAFSELPKTCFVYVKRDYLSNAFSILKLRKKLNGNIQEWGSIKPIQYNKLKDLTVYEQIAGQILCMENEYLTQLNQLPSNNKLFFQYEEICNDPHLFLDKVETLLGKHCSMPHKDFEVVDSFKIPQTEQYPPNEIRLFLDARFKIQKMFPELIEWNK